MILIGTLTIPIYSNNSNNKILLVHLYLWKTGAQAPELCQ